MAEKKKSSSGSLLLKAETLIIVIFFGCFIMWAVSKCNATRAKYKEEKALVDTAKVIPSPSPVVATAPTTTKNEANTAIAPIPIKPISTPKTQTPQEVKAPPVVTKKDNGTKLYVAIDGLKVRTEPSLKGKVLGSLPLHAELTFMNETTKSTQKINLGAEVADEPWVKIKTKKGTIGWVYGAGVSYYKTTRKGAF